MTELALELEKLFLSKGYQWKDEEGNSFIPNAEQIQRVLDLCRESVVALLEQAGDDEYVTLEQGRLYITARPDHIDLYVHLGEL